ncbi:MAG: flagellar biosynthetic protein FliQ [Acidobacteriota bacterium]
MDAHFLHLAQRGLMITALVSAPALAAAVVVGLGMATLQAVTQIQEQSAQVVLKIGAIYGTLLVLGYWMAAQVFSYTRLIFDSFGTWVG